MGKLEKEFRYRVDDNNINKIKKISKSKEEESTQIDLTLGFDGFNSLNKYGYVCRVRKKINKIWMEIKNKRDDNSFYETEIYIKDFSSGVKFFEALGMKPYLYMNRKREILEYKGLKIFIDDIELLGKFVEIEYQEVEDSKNVIEEFLKLTEIKPYLQPLYGDIFKELIEKDEKFKESFEKKLKNFLDNN